MVVSPGLRPRRVPLGLFRGLVLELDLRVQAQVYLGLFERETYRWIRRALGRCAWAIDVGAANGELSVCLLRASRAEHVFAFEPQSSEVATLRRNLAHNGCSDDGRLVIVEKLAGRADQAGCVALDDLPIDRTKRGFVKIDVDGAEMAVLEGAQTLLQTAIVDLLVETHSHDLEREAIDFLSGRGYACTVIANAWWRAIVPEQRPIPHNRWLWAANG